MRSLDPTGQWLTAFFIAIFALPVVAVIVGLAMDGHFWSNFLPMAGFIIFLSLLRGPLDRMGWASRFLLLFCVVAAGTSIVTLSRGEIFNLATAAMLGLAFAGLDFVAEYFRSKREAEIG